MPVVDVDADVTKKVSVGEVVGKITGDVEVATDGTATISELPVSKLQDGTARQLLQTDAAGTGVEWTDNVDVPGTLDVTGVTTLDDALNVAGLASLDGGIDVDGAFTVANTSGNIATSGTLGVTGQSTLASAAVSDLTENRVVIAGASGELEDSANLTFDGSELGVTGTLDVSSNATVGGDLTVTGDLTVEGATTTLETQTVVVEDKNIELGVVDTPTDTTADGGGITLKGATDKTLNWVNATDAWTSSEHIELASGKEFYIDGNGVLNATTLGSGVINSSLTSVGTISTGTWEGDAIDAAYLDSTVVTTSDTGTVTSTMILDGTIVDADVNASAAIAGTKIDPDFGSQDTTTAGTSTAASFIPTSSTVPTNGVYLPATNQIALATNGAQALYINSDGNILVADGNRMEIDEIRARDGDGLKLFDDAGAGIFIKDGGNVGVGTSGPLSLLHTTGSRDYTGSTPDASSYDVNFQSGTAFVAIGQSNGIPTIQGHGTGTSYNLALCPNAGNVGIGDTEPSETLTVKGASSVDPFSVSGPSSEFLRVDDDGRLLVGTSTARSNFINSTFSAALQIEGTDHNSSAFSQVRNSNNGLSAYLTLAKSRGTSTGSNTLVQDNDDFGVISFQGSDGTEFVEGAQIKAEVDGTPGANDMPGRLVFSTTADGASSPTERMRISSDGFVFIGKTDTASAFANDGYHISNAGVSYQTADGSEAVNLSRQTSNGNIVVFRRGTSTAVGTISVTTTATAYNTSSDYRLKENVVPLTGAADRLNQLQVHRFNFIADPDTTVDGFLAHEAQAIVPECVTGEKDAVDDEGNPVYQGIDQSKIVPLVVAALQEALAEIETLKARLANAGIN